MKPDFTDLSHSPQDIQRIVENVSVSLTTFCGRTRTHNDINLANWRPDRSRLLLSLLDKQPSYHEALQLCAGAVVLRSYGVVC